MTTERFPVLVTGQMKYVVWVDAEDAKDAHQAIEDNPSDWVEGVQPVDAWLDVESDPKETARFIRVYGSDFMPQHDAHVHAHRAEMHRRDRAAKQAACTAAGHPNRQTFANDDTWCGDCSAYVKHEEVSA